MIQTSTAPIQDTTDHMNRNTNTNPNPNTKMSPGDTPSAGTPAAPYTAVIIGGGPAGLFCACRISGDGRRVLLLEKMPACGKKLCITGAGRCNLTHTGTMSEFLSHYGDGGKFLRPALMNFKNTDLLAYFHDRGLPFAADENGKYFPETGSARDVLAVLLSECTRNGVEIRRREAVEAIDAADGTFAVRTARACYTTETVVLATGGASYPTTGSTGDGYTLAERLGLPVTETGPALAALICRNFPFRGLTGISFDDIALSLYRDNKKIREVRGDIILTLDGISGPGALHLSRYVRPGDGLHVGFAAGTDAARAKEEITGLIAGGKNRQVKTVLSQTGVPARFLIRLLDLAGIPHDATCAHLTKASRTALIRYMTNCPLTLAGTEGYRTAMATRGGVARDALRPKTMETKEVPGLFCIGEVVDIDGDTGGYNLQAAFSTAALAADAILQATDKRKA